MAIKDKQTFTRRFFRGICFLIFTNLCLFSRAWVPTSSSRHSLRCSKSDTISQLLTPCQNVETSAYPKNFLECARTAILSSTLAAAILLFPPSTTNIHQPTWILPSAHADETTVAPQTKSVSIPPYQQETKTVLDEVWTLVDKYYIDRTYNGQDWNKVKQNYKALERKAEFREDSQHKLIIEMVKSLGDKYSRYLDPEQYASIQKFDLIGVGVSLMPNPDNKQIMVGAPPVKGSAADKAGLQVGDYVIAVNGVSTQGKTAFDIIDQIADVPDAPTVSMTIRSSDAPDGEVREVTMQRQFLQVKNPVRYKMSENRNDGTKIGFIRILEFNSLVKPKLEEALKVLKDAGANAFVLDLRMNTGGAFQSAVEIGSLFMEDKISTYVVDSTKSNLPFRTQKGHMAIDAHAPIVIWTDGSTASASEVLAGSLHDNCRAILMGEKTFGKGLIQAVYGLQDGSGLVLTVAKYVTPKGDEIQGIGINPDIRGRVGIPLPGLSTDTSQIDFTDVRNRLNMCQAPP